MVPFAWNYPGMVSLAWNDPGMVSHAWNHRGNDIVGGVRPASDQASLTPASIGGRLPIQD